MIYPKKKPEMIQAVGKTGVQAFMEGKERIYSKGDTQKIITMAKACKDNKDLVALGKYVLEATKRQDSRKPEFTDQ